MWSNNTNKSMIPSKIKVQQTYHSYIWDDLQMLVTWNGILFNLYLKPMICLRDDFDQSEA